MSTEGPEHGRQSGPEDYHESVRNLAQFGEQQCALIRFALHAANISFHSVQFRVKDERSAERKLQLKANRYESCADLMDLLGIRVITYFPDAVDAVAAVLEREYSINWEHSEDKRQLLDPDQFGYLSKHYVVRLSDARKKLVEYSELGDRCFEVQIRSVLQHAWAEIEHDLGYKAGGLPDPIRRRFARVAGLLETADEEFRALRDTIVQYREAAGATIESAPDTLPLDQATIDALIATSQLVSQVDADLAQELNTQLGPANGTYVDLIAQRLKLARLNDVAEVEEKLRQWRDDVVEVGLALGRGGFSGQRGMSLSLLGLILAAEADNLHFGDNLRQTLSIFGVTGGVAEHSADLLIQTLKDGRMGDRADSS